MESVEKQFKSNFNPISIKELLSSNEPDISWVWENIIPEGRLFLLVAYPKVGKSELISHLAVAVSQGKEFLDHKTKQTGVLILALEEHRQDIKRRLSKLGSCESDPIEIHFGELKNDPETIQDLKEFIISRHIGLMVIDTISCFWKIQSENSNTEVHNALMPLLTLAHDTNCAVGLIHHKNKQGGEDERSIRGASSLFGIVEQALLLENRKGGNGTQRILKTKGRYQSFSPDKLVIDFIDGKYVCLGTKKEMEAQAMKDGIYKLISDSQEGITEEEIKKQTGLSRTPVRKVLKALEEDHKAKTHGTGKRGDPLKYCLA